MARWSTFDDSPHQLVTKTPDGRDLVFLTGTAGLNLKGTGSSWFRDDVYHLVGPTWRRLDNVAPIASLGAIANDHTAENAGWATDNCRWARYNNRILLMVATAVRDSDGFLIRFNYQVTAIGLLS